MKRASAALLVPLVALAQGDALFDDTRSEGSSTPSSAVSASSAAGSTPFSEWDGITQLFPRPVAAPVSHAESAEFAESDSHAESAESAEFDSHAESAEFESHAESAENAEPGGASSPSEPGSPAGGAAERSEAEGVIQHSAFSIQHSSLPSLSLVSEFPLPDSAPEGLSGIAWTSNPEHPNFVGSPFSLTEEPYDICGPDSYALCEDSGGWIHYAEIGVDRGSGAVTSAVFRARERLAGANESSDLEGVAYARSRWNLTHLQLYASDEHHRCIAQDRPLAITSPSPAVAISLPEPLRAHRPNKGVEAMCLSPDDQALWLANEDALPEDGPIATTERGALVRLWRMDAIAGTSEAQLRRRRAQGGAGPVEPAWWFYELDPAAGGTFPHLPDPFNGLAELCALPDGRLLALERAYGLRTRGPDDPRASLIAISIYLVDPLGSAPAGPSHAESAESKPHAESAEFAELESHAESAESAEPGGASSPSEPGSPVGGAAERSEAEGVIQHSAFSIQHSPSSPLPKTLLWRGLTGRANYEGMTLGPELADGSRALILVSDGDVTRKGAFAFPWSKRLLSFRLRLP